MKRYQKSEIDASGGHALVVPAGVSAAMAEFSLNMSEGL